VNSGVNGDGDVNGGGNTCGGIMLALLLLRLERQNCGAYSSSLMSRKS
jgi:hypothetical protein